MAMRKGVLWKTCHLNVLLLTSADLCIGYNEILKKDWIWALFNTIDYIYYLTGKTPNEGMK